jgi:hypothetical protein
MIDFIKEAVPMTLTLELPPEVEADLSAQAQESGLPLHAYVENLLKHQVGPAGAKPTMSIDQFEAELDALAEDSENLPDLPAELLRRENLYQDLD